jgi:hypothetical protein
MTIKEVINKWDPIGLFPGAPDNEYHSEIQVIEEILLQTDDVKKVAEGLYFIFKKYFGNIFLKTVEECTTIAKKIIACKE